METVRLLKAPICGGSVWRNIHTATFSLIYTNTQLPPHQLTRLKFKTATTSKA